MSVDNRRTLRVACDLPVSWNRGGRVLEARAVDLNADGLFLRVDAPFDPNMLMDLEVELPDGRVSFAGVSRFIGKTRHGKGIGVQIYVMSREDRVRWRAYHQHRLAEVLATMPPDVARHLRAR